MSVQQPAGLDRPGAAVAASVAANAKRVIQAVAAGAPRSRQARPGPSEIGTPCTRRLGYRLLNWPQVNVSQDRWATVIGTAVHAWMARAFTFENTQLGWDRYLVEHRVALPWGITGTADLYDKYLHTVIDWKVTGRDYRSGGPGAQYRTQVQLYALGLQLAGEQPQHVAIAFLPRGARLDMLHVHAEPYDPAAAVAAVRRCQTVGDALVQLDPEAHPERWALLPAADAECTWCPWFLPGSDDLGRGCPGAGTRPEGKVSRASCA